MKSDLRWNQSKDQSWHRRLAKYLEQHRIMSGCQAVHGKPHFVYSWKLEPTDKLPKGKKPCLSPQGVGKAGKHRFRFACEYRRRTDDSL